MLNAGSIVKSVQRGVSKFGGNTLSIDITPVNLEKSILVVIGISGGAATSNSLSQSTQLTLKEDSIQIKSDRPISNNAYISWQVIEFY